MPPYSGLPVYSSFSKPLETLIAVAKKERPAALVIKNARVFNVFSGEFVKNDVAVQGGVIAALGDYSGEAEHDAAGTYLVPGFIDSHVHLESTMACPAEFARIVAAQGTSAVVADPHEIANVAGAAGLEYILAATEGLPITVYITLPSCVPASPLEWGGAKLSAADLKPFLGHPRVLGLGEMMNFPGVLAGTPEVMDKLRLASDRCDIFGWRPRVDGHSPGLSGAALQAYIATGISSDHECTTVEEARERLALGMAVMLREGTAAKNLLTLLPAVTEHTASQCLLATDDIHLPELMDEGHINYLVKLAVRDGRVPLPTILKMASFNTARHYGLSDRGAIAPGYYADFALYPDLESWRPLAVWQRGKLVAAGGECLWTRTLDVEKTALPGAERIYHSVRPSSLAPDSLKIKAAGKNVRVIGVVPGQIITEHLMLDLPQTDGAYEADVEADIAKLAVLERHRGSGNLGLGFVRGLGLKCGAVASTVAHDSHNLIVAGMNDADMFAGIVALQKMQGGLVVVDGGEVLAALPLPIAGLMSECEAGGIAVDMAKLGTAVQRLRGGLEGDIFMILSFLSLPVIPKLKLTEAGLVDVEKFEIVDLVS